ncbi:MAG: DUF4357 domain-containing protein, partial [Candidatus Roizmanbacteria bacterium]|nr:DUF4357 domain-containing protein [Candidatus Roizmanbacteria bacterium]
KISAKELYEVIKQRAKNEKWDSQTILQFTNKLNKASTIYTELIDANIGNLSINRGLTDIKHIQAGPSYSLLLRITPLFKEGLLNETQYLEIIKLIELFHIRWGITGQSTSRLNEIYYRMCTTLNGTPAEAVSKMIEDEYLSWASPIKDSMFLSAFQKEFGKPGDTRTKYIIWKLGNPAGEISLNFDEVHTEHIMPQTLSEGWVQNLEQASGKNNEEIIKSHSVLVNKIGNLSLIKGDWNISMSNRLFSDKKQYYANSEISLTKELANRNKWTFDEVVNRTKEFAEKAVQIWKFSKPIPEIETAAENVNRIRREKYKLDSNIQLYCKGPAAEGIAHIIDNNIVRVLKGSRARLDCSPSFETHVYKIKRDQLISEGILKKEGDSLIFTSDYDFDHTSPAAAIILGKASNGWTSWKDDNGIDLDHLIHKNNVVADKFEDKLKMGQVYLKENIEEIFNTNFGGRIKGITLRRDSAENQYIILFKVKNSKYKDFGSKDKFVYYGEGGDADQKLTPANQALISAIDDRRTIYGFWQDEGGSGYEYIGTLLIDSYEYTLEPESGYKVYKFNVDRVGLDSKDNKD